MGIMAIYHLSAKPISRATGRSATGAAAYRSGERITDERTGLTFDYGKKSGVDHTEIICPANAPAWLTDLSRGQLWNLVEATEKRKDAQVCREVEVALPVELSFEQQRELVRGFVKEQFAQRGMVADLAMHHTTGHAPHCHILLTMRDIDRQGFGQKNRTWNDKQLLETWREQWAEHTNRALERAGHTVRVDHRSLEAQGIDRIPQPKLGAKVVEMERRGIRTERGSEVLAVEEKNAAIAALKSDLEASRNERHHEVETSPEPGADRGRTGTLGRVAGDTGRPSGGEHSELGAGQQAAGGGLEQGAGGGRLRKRKIKYVKPLAWPPLSQTIIFKKPP